MKTRLSPHLGHCLRQTQKHTATQATAGKRHKRSLHVHTPLPRHLLLGLREATQAESPSARNMTDKIKTRICIISDTHGEKPKARAPTQDSEYDTEQELADGPPAVTPTGYRHPLPPADVLLHCGDLTKLSKLEEYENTFSTIREAPAKIKIVIAGNHDLSLDEVFMKQVEDGLRVRRMADKADVDRIIEEAKADGVVYLEEGTHTFDLKNGARLKVFASQWTPVFGGWAFQYETECDDDDDQQTASHKFDIPEGVDVAMTHGPPRGILDYAGYDGVRAGCEWLFDSVRKARPRIHCFGHIHEAWGAYLAKWKADSREGDHKRVHEATDEEGSRSIMKLTKFKPSRLDKHEEWTRKMGQVKEASKNRGVKIDTTEGENKLKTGEQTLFVNAAIMDIRYRPIQAPWIIDIDLPKSSSMPDIGRLELDD